MKVPGTALSSRGARHLCCSVLALGACASPSGEVRHWGAMREVMREGKTEARVAVAELERPPTIAVGALEGLAGEITIIDGERWIARGDTRAVEAGSDPIRATLLTSAEVDGWQTILWFAGGDLAALEGAIAALLHRSLAEPGDTVPFVVEGKVQELSLHVVRGFCPHGDENPEHEPARFAAPSGARVRLAGFFAPQRAGELTHHGTALHVHAVVEDSDGALHMGHVDHAVLSPGASLRLPQRN